MIQRDYVKICRARDQKFGTEEQQRILALIDEDMYPAKFDFPLTLQYELTSHCNVYCKHCYNNSGVANNMTDPMTVAEWKKLSRYIVSKGGIFQCVISGGEPLLLGDDLFDIMDILHDDGTSFLVITNGFLLTQDKVRKFAKYRYKWFQVSIDGSNPEFHDSFRQREGSWERAVNGAYMISKEGIPLTIAHSVSPGNVYDVEKMCQLAYELGASSIILGEVNPSGRSANSMDLVLTMEQKNHLYQMIDQLSSFYAGKMTVQRSSSTRQQLLRYKNTPNSGAIIRPNGDIRLDCMAPFVLGNVLKNDLETIWQEKGGDCWQDDRVLDYINGFDETVDINSKYKNYYDKDILL